MGWSLKTGFTVCVLGGGSLLVITHGFSSSGDCCCWGKEGFSRRPCEGKGYFSCLAFGSLVDCMGQKHIVQHNWSKEQHNEKHYMLTKSMLYQCQAAKQNDANVIGVSLPMIRLIYIYILILKLLEIEKEIVREVVRGDKHNLRKSANRNAQIS